MADDLEVKEPPSSNAIIDPNYTFGTVTDQIASVVLTQKTPKFWFGGLTAGLLLLMLFLLAVVTLFAKGIGIWGLRNPVMWGVRHHQLRLVDRYRARGHADFGDLLLLQSALAQFDQSIRRSDDAVRSGLRGHVPHPPPRPSVADVLAVPVSQHHGE